MFSPGRDGRNEGGSAGGDGASASYSFIFRTDVKGYYASIDREILYRQVQALVDDPIVLDLLEKYLKRFVSDGGEYRDIVQGISLGCPLSPLMGSLFLKPLDDKMAQMGCFYVCYMDDWVILAPTRWKLRGAIRAVNEVMSEVVGGEAPGQNLYWADCAGV